MSQDRLFLIDAHALCYRAFFAIKNLSNAKGQPTNAIYGFLNILRKILKDYQPTHLGVCFDTGKKTLRQEKFKEYKIQRPSMPDDLISQIPWIKKIVRAHHIPIYERDGYEADDCLATIVEKLKKKDIEIVIVSDDKDMCQLVNDKVKIYHSRMDKILDVPAVKDRLGILPEFIPDFLGLAGDSVDNIPGVKGIGEVTAKQLITDFGHLEGIYKNIDKVKSEKVRQKLIEQKEQAFLSKELSLLTTDVPIDVELSELRQEEPDNKQLVEMYRELGFRRLTEEASLSSQEVAPAIDVKVQTLIDNKGVEEFLKKAKAGGLFSFVFDKGEDGQVGGLVLAAGQDVYRIDIAQKKLWQMIFDVKNIVRNTYNLKEVKKTAAKLDLEIEGSCFDCLLSGYLLTTGQAANDLSALVFQYLNENISADAPAAEWVLRLEKLYTPLIHQLQEKSLDKLLFDLELPLSDVLSRMEQNGVTLDLKLLSELSKSCQKRIDESLQGIYKHAGMEFNLNSPKQLSQVLFESLKLPVIKKTKTGFSTDEEVLTRLADKHPLPALILEYRQIAKLKSTYIDALPQMVDPKTHRIHAFFNQTGAETGRLSSNNPNLQNIPIRSDLGKQIRRAFVASDSDHILMSADYSQIELRILAHLSQDRGLMEAFANKQDIHTSTAAQIFDVEESKVDEKMRDSAKRVNFGIIYGISAFGLAKDLGIPNAQAQDFIDRYFLRFPRVKTFMEETIARAEEDGFVVTLLNRRRYIPEITSRNIGLRQFAQRQAINTPVQGSAADLIKLAMIAIDKELTRRKLQSKMIITVHDELVFDVLKKEKDEMTSLVRDLMEHALELSVPIEVSLKLGSNWLEMKKQA